jgi:tellurite resistance protein TerC
MQWVRKITAAVGLDRVPFVRKLIVSVIGVTVVFIGIALLVLPGPAFIVIPVGLLILASEFAWARLLLIRGKNVVKKARRGKWRETLFPTRQ